MYLVSDSGNNGYNVGCGAIQTYNTGEGYFRDELGLTTGVTPDDQQIFYTGGTYNRAAGTLLIRGGDPVPDTETLAVLLGTALLGLGAVQRRLK